MVVAIARKHRFRFKAEEIFVDHMLRIKCFEWKYSVCVCGGRGLRIFVLISSQIIFIGLRSSKYNLKRPDGVVGVCGKGHLGMFFFVGRCVLREWVVRGGGLDGCFGEQGLLVGIQEYLERFHRGCVDYLSRQFVPKSTARMAKASWCRHVQHLCWRNL